MMQAQPREAVMPEPIDVIIPILQRIQTDLAALGCKVDAETEILVRNTKKLDDIIERLTSELGITIVQNAPR